MFNLYHYKGTWLGTRKDLFIVRVLLLLGSLYIQVTLFISCNMQENYVTDQNIFCSLLMYKYRTLYSLVRVNQDKDTLKYYTKENTISTERRRGSSWLSGGTGGVLASSVCRCGRSTGLKFVNFNMWIEALKWQKFNWNRDIRSQWLTLKVVNQPLRGFEVYIWLNFDKNITKESKTSAQRNGGWHFLGCARTNASTLRVQDSRVSEFEEQTNRHPCCFRNTPLFPWFFTRSRPGGHPGH